MSRRPFWPLIAALSFSATASAQTPAASVDAIFKDLASSSAPGCAVGATRANAPLLAKAYGMADLEHGIALTPQSVFYMASVSKQFMALSILLLERDGKLQLDDQVRQYVPELPDYAAAITIRQLLQHTSGLRDYLTLSALAGHSSDQVITERDVLRALQRQTRLNFAPGAEHLYSNSGYVLSSIIVHRVSGRPLDDFARERIFAPLGMHSTRFQHDHSSPIVRRALGYVKRDDSWRIANSMLDVVGDGGMYSSVDDMLRWAAAFEHPDFAPLLSRMHTPGTLGDGSRIANGYGMGLSAGSYRGVPTVSHGGALAGYRTSFLRLPGAGLSVVTLCNNGTANAGRLASMVAEIYAPEGMTVAASAAAGAGASQAQQQASPRTPVPRELGEAMAGAYYSAELDATYRLVPSADSLILEVGNNVVGLSLRGVDQVVAANGFTIKAVRDRRGRVTGLVLGAGRVRDVVFERR